MLWAVKCLFTQAVLAGRFEISNWFCLEEAGEDSINNFRSIESSSESHYQRRCYRIEYHQGVTGGTPPEKLTWLSYLSLWTPARSRSTNADHIHSAIRPRRDFNFWLKSWTPFAGFANSMDYAARQPPFAPGLFQVFDTRRTGRSTVVISRWESECFGDNS